MIMKKIKCKAIVNPIAKQADKNISEVTVKKKIRISDVVTAVAYCLLFLFLIIFVTQIPRPSSSSEVELPVIIVNSYHKDSYVTLVPTGKSVVSVPVPERNQIAVLYKDKEYIINDKDVYESFKNKINDNVTGVFTETTWSNGNVTYELISLYD